MSHHESQAKGPDGRMVDRMLFFSDAVFAIVLTIMVLELKAPVLGHDDKRALSAVALWEALAEPELLRTLFAYVVSFALVGLWWTIHMRVTRSLHQFDWPTAVANLFFLFSVTVIPFAAAVLGQSPQNPAAWVIYWGASAAASFTLTLMMIVVSRNKGTLLGGMGGRERLARILQSVGPGIGFAIGAWLAAVDQLDLSKFCWLAIPPVMLLARIIHRQPKSPPASEPA